MIKKLKKMIVDRIEEDFIVLEIAEGEFINIPKKLIPEAKEGDFVEIKVNNEESQIQEEKINYLMNDLFEEK